jgi:hypothetical protein
MPTGKFAAVVQSKPLWTAAFSDHAIQSACDAPARQTRIHLKGQTFPGECVDHGQHANRPAVRQTIVDEIEGPLLIGSGGHECGRPDTRQTLAPAPFHAQTRGPVNAKQALMVDTLAFAPQQNPEPAVAITWLVSGELAQSLLQCVVLFFVGLVTITRPGDMGELAGFALSGGECLDQMRRIRAPVYELSPFFITRAFGISLSSASSATSFFSRLFSSSRCRILVASFGSSPPNVAFQE